MDKELLDFIQSSFKSVWALELVMFLRGHRDRGWTEQELVLELRGSLPAVSQGLQTLGNAGLVAADADGMFRYTPASPVLDRLAEKLEQAHRDKPFAVHRAILTAHNEKLYTLADAFKLKRD